MTAEQKSEQARKSLKLMESTIDHSPEPWRTAVMNTIDTLYAARIIAAERLGSADPLHILEVARMISARAGEITAQEAETCRMDYHESAP